MVLSQALSFLYGVKASSPSAERTNLNTPLVIRELVDWSLEDSLNAFKVFKVTITKNSVDLKNIYTERDIYLPAFKFEGIITGITDIREIILEHGLELQVIKMDFIIMIKQDYLMVQLNMFV